VGREHREVFDLPPTQVIEHQLVKRRCGCGTATSASAPAGVTAPVQYGPRITAIIVYLYVGQFLSRKRTAAALAELFGTPVSMGTVATMTTRAAAGLEGFTDWVRAHLVAAQVVNFDETGLRVEGRLRWVHSASTGKYSLITVHDRRGVKGMDAAGVLPAFTGIAVHDGWATYDTYTSITHALCGAHVLRELQAVTDLAEQDLWCWAAQPATRCAPSTSRSQAPSPSATRSRASTRPRSPTPSTATAAPCCSASRPPVPGRTRRWPNTTPWPGVCSTATTTTCGSPSIRGSRFGGAHRWIW
jgi:transposase